jgi:phage gp36-like protein
VQPTEQCVQTDLIDWIAEFIEVWADALVTEPPIAPIAASPPTANPDPRRNERRSTDFSATLDRRLARWGRVATPLVFFLSIVILHCCLAV